MASGTGTATVDFGAAPGGNLATVAVTGQSGITSGSHVEAWVMGEASANHSAYEHAITPLTVRCGDVVAGTGFTVYASSHEMRLTGQFKVRWVWST